MTSWIQELNKPPGRTSLSLQGPSATIQLDQQSLTRETGHQQNMARRTATTKSSAAVVYVEKQHVDQNIPF